jgi:hypothetical protein
MTDPAGASLDAVDQRILDEVRGLHGRLDPPPADLDKRVRFAIALDTVDIEVARLAEDLLVGSGARTTDRARTLTFGGDSRTIMVMVTELADGRVRVDGWLAPAARLRVELRVAGTPATSEVVTSDDAGRFVFDGASAGLAQLVVHPSAAGGTRVVTPSLRL